MSALEPRWRTRAELLALIAQYREWARHYDDVQMTAAIHGRPVPGTPSLLERVRAMRGAA